MPAGVLVLVRLALVGCFGVAAFLYIGMIAIAVIRQGSISNLAVIASFALPWLFRIYALLLAAFSVYLAVILFMTKRNLRDTEYTLMRFMSLPLEERHALIKAWKRGPYRDP